MIGVSMAIVKTDALASLQLFSSAKEKLQQNVSTLKNNRLFWNIHI